MIRKLAVALLGAGVLIPGLANALGLGEITNSSGLGQPLSAKIELTQTRDLTSEEIKVSLASQKDFDAAGVSRDYVLTELVFDVVVKPDGKSYVTIRSRRPMNEPYVNFLVELLWPQGRLLREYTVLLDPPVTSDARRVAVTPPVASAATKPNPTTSAVNTHSSSAGAGSSSASPRGPVEPSGPVLPKGNGKPTWKVSHATAAPAKPKEPTPPVAEPAVKPVAEASAKKAVPAVAESGAAQYGPTTRNDSLWKIAAKLRPSSAVSVHQTMVALAKTNPDAFIAGNINLLKTGKTLQAPSVDQAEQLSVNDAIKEVARQNSAWRDMIAGNKEGLKKALASQQIQGSDASVSKPPAANGPDGQLKLATSDTASQAAKSGAGAGGGSALEGKLSSAEESLDKSARENQDLKSHLGALQDEVAQSEKVLKLKDNQIAAMQAKMAQLEQEVAQAKSSSTAQTAPAKTVVNQAPVEPAPQPDYNYHPQTAPTTTTASAAVTEPAAPTQSPAQTVAPAATKLPEPQQAVPAQPPAAVSKPAPEPPSLLSNLSPMLLYGVPGAALLVGLVMFLARKKKPQEDDFVEPGFGLPDTKAAEKEQSFPLEATPAVAEPEAVAKDMTSAAAVQTPSADPVAEADIYIAYRQFPRAVDVLEKAIAREPVRADLRLKLLEVLVETGDKRGFEHHEAALAGLGDTSAKVRASELRATLFGVTAVGATMASLDDDLNFAPDDTAFDHIAEFDSSIATSGTITHKNLDDLNLDFSFDQDQTIIKPTQTSNVEDDFAPLEFTLDDSFATDHDAKIEEIEVTPVSGNALDFDFSLDLTSTAEAASMAAPEMSILDEELPFEPVADDLASFTKMESDFSLEFDLPAGDGPLLSVDEPILMPSIVDEDVTSDSADFAFDPMTGEFEPATKPTHATAPPTAAEAEDLEFLAGSDEISTKLDLARAYIDMGDSEGAKDILDEVVVEGNDAQKTEARELISRLEA